MDLSTERFVERKDGKISLTESEIRCLFQRLFGGPIPDGEDLETAGMACMFYVGAERIEFYLTECRKEGLI
jgi:hypothetical protein